MYLERPVQIEVLCVWTGQFPRQAGMLQCTASTPWADGLIKMHGYNRPLELQLDNLSTSCLFHRAVSRFNQRFTIYTLEQGVFPFLKGFK